MHEPRYVAPDYERPIETDDYVRLVPPSATIKGMFFTNLVDCIGSNQPRVRGMARRYVAFKDYPLVEQVRLIAEVARLTHADLPQREAIRRIGHGIYPKFAESLVGRVLFAAVGKDPAAMLHAGTKAYAMSASVGKVEIVDLQSRSAILRLIDMYNYIDCYQVGILEGAFSVLGLQPAIRIHLDDLTNGVFEVRW